MSIVINMTKAKSIGHNLRREKLVEEFAPLDAEIAKQMPGTNMAVIEAQLQSIRDMDAVVKTQIDAAETPEDIKKALGVG